MKEGNLQGDLEKEFMLTCDTAGNVGGGGEIRGCKGRAAVASVVW